jgi:hypothetical protein
MQGRAIQFFTEPQKQLSLTTDSEIMQKKLVTWGKIG